MGEGEGEGERERERERGRGRGSGRGRGRGRETQKKKQEQARQREAKSDGSFCKRIPGQIPIPAVFFCGFYSILCLACLLLEEIKSVYRMGNTYSPHGEPEMVD